MLSEPMGIDDAARVNERNKTIAARLAFEIAVAPEPVQAPKTEWAEQLDLRRRKSFFNSLPRHQWQTIKVCGSRISSIDGESDHAMIAILLKVGICELRGHRRTKNYNVRHYKVPRSRCELAFHHWLAS